MNMTGPTISSRVKISEVLSAVREMSKRLSQQDITDEQLKLFYKISLLEVASLLNGSLNRFNPSQVRFTRIHIFAQAESFGWFQSLTGSIHT